MTKIQKLATPSCCLVVLVLLAVNVFVGAFAVIYDFHHIFHKSISWIAAVLIGMVFAEAIIPITVIVWILVLAGVLS